MITQKEKFSLKDIIELYDNDPIAVKAGNQNKNLFSLDYLKFICDYLKNKIHRNDLSTLEVKQTNVKMPKTVVKTSREVSAHLLLDMIQNIDNNKTLQQQIVMSKCTLTTKPMQIFILKYDEAISKFSITIYNTD